MASELKIDRTPLETRGYEVANPAHECLPTCAGAPCWDLEALVPLTMDAEKVVEVFGSGYAEDGRNLAAD